MITTPVTTTTRSTHRSAISSARPPASPGRPNRRTPPAPYHHRAPASVSWSPNTSKHTYWGSIWDKQAVAYELSVLQPLHPRWSIYAGVGYYDLSDLVDTGYWYWSTG